MKGGGQNSRGIRLKDVMNSWLLMQVSILDGWGFFSRTKIQCEASTHRGRVKGPAVALVGLCGRSSSFIKPRLSFTRPLKLPYKRVLWTEASDGVADWRHEHPTWYGRRQFNCTDSVKHPVDTPFQSQHATRWEHAMPIAEAVDIIGRFERTLTTTRTFWQHSPFASHRDILTLFLPLSSTI